MTAITVDIWADISCPWCFIGKRRFEKALSQFAGKDAVEVTFRSFVMAPDTPADFPGTEAEFLTANMGMAAEQVRAMLGQATTVEALAGRDRRGLCARSSARPRRSRPARAQKPPSTTASIPIATHTPHCL